MGPALLDTLVISYTLRRSPVVCVMRYRAHSVPRFVRWCSNFEVRWAQPNRIERRKKNSKIIEQISVRAILLSVCKQISQWILEFGCLIWTTFPVKIRHYQKSCIQCVFNEQTQVSKLPMPKSIQRKKQRNDSMCSSEPKLRNEFCGTSSSLWWAQFSQLTNKRSLFRE